MSEAEIKSTSVGGLDQQHAEALELLREQGTRGGFFLIVMDEDRKATNVASGHNRIMDSMHQAVRYYSNLFLGADDERDDE